MGLAKVIPSGMTWTVCGTPDYIAPEIILNEGHDHAVDYWAMGILTYELLAGVPPFFDNNPMATYEKILANRVYPPEFFSKSVKDIIRKLLKINKSKRFGNTHGGEAAIMNHKWYGGFDWDGLIKKKLPPPIIPELKTPEDISHFNP
ncbi:unnamed protein product, partial [Choristocarpus tenellus]